MAAFSPQCLLLLGLLMAVSEGRGTTSSVVLANPHEDTTLQCVDSNLTNPKSCYRFRWMKISTDGQRDETLLTWPKNGPHSSRVKLGAEGQTSLTVMNVDKSDEGVYSCELCQGWNCTRTNRITLRVRDCKVLSPVMAAVGRPFKLDCPVDVAHRPQNISWLLLKGSTAQLPDSERVQLKATSLIIQSTIVSDLTWYRCNHTHTHRCYEIKVIAQDEEKQTIKPTESETMFMTMTSVSTEETNTETVHAEGQSRRTVVAAAVSSVIIFLVLAAAVIGVLAYHFYKRRRIARHTKGSQSDTMVPNPEYDTVIYSVDQQDSALYAEVTDESLWTFQI